jgi:hypothetical protein
MADDIVLKIAVEGQDEAAAALKEVGASASTSFEDTQKAAETAGVSIEEFGKLSEKTQQAYIDLSKRVADGSKEIVASTKEVQDAAASGGRGTKELGGGLDEVSEKSGISSREMRGLGKIMNQLGAGEAASLALSFQKVGASLGVLGVAALALAMAAGHIVKFAKDAADAAKGMEDLAKASGTSVESLKNLEGAFLLAGVSAKKFKDSMQGLLVSVLEAAPKMADEIAASTEQVTRATVALQKARADEGFQGRALNLQAFALAAQSIQLRLQGQQLAQNLATLREQLATLDQMQALESKRADLTLRDAEANLKLLKLKRDLLNGVISQAQYDKAVKLEEKAALDRSIQKAEIEVETAKQEKDALGEKQEAQRAGLQLQIAQIRLAQAQLPIQQAQLRLQQEQNLLARQQFEQLKGLDIAGAQRKQIEALANAWGPLIEQLKRMKDGSQELINPLASVETRTKALLGLLAAEGMAPEDMAKGFNAAGVEINKFLPIIARMYDGLTDLQKLKFDQDLRKLNLPEEQIQQLRKGSEEFGKLRQRADDVAWARKEVEGLGKAMDVAGDKASTFGLIASGSFLKSLRQLGDGLVIVGRAVSNLVLTAVEGAWKWINDTFVAQVDGMKPTMAANATAITQWVTTAVPNAWKWITDTFSGAVGAMAPIINQGKSLIETWVTTPVANAWAWIKDMFFSAVDAIRQRLGGGTSAPASAGGGGDGFARGGLLGGRGTGTSDSNLAWVSRGEHLQPASVVRQPGVLAFLEALRLSGGNLRAVLNNMGHFALGGLVMPKLPAGLAGGAMNNVTINFPGLPEITGLRASSSAVDELRKAAAMAQVRSGGRKPSRYS